MDEASESDPGRYRFETGSTAYYERKLRARMASVGTGINSPVSKMRFRGTFG
jgi:hypothetical protein